MHANTVSINSREEAPEGAVNQLQSHRTAVLLNSHLKHKSESYDPNVINAMILSTNPQTAPTIALTLPTTGRR